MKDSKTAKKFDLAKFEKLSTKGEVLKGGFSTAFSGGSALPIGIGDINGNNVGNCHVTNSGNCVAHCGG